MITVSREDSDFYFDKFFDEVEKDWFKLEVLQFYGEDDSDSLRYWLADNKTKAKELLIEEFADAKTDWKDSQKLMPKNRIHIVEKPLSKYLEWEIEFYKIYNIPIDGEEIYLIKRDRIEKDLKIPDGDFLLFDNGRVIKNNYDKNGIMTSINVYENEDIEYFLNLKKSLLSNQNREII